MKNGEITIQGDHRQRNGRDFEERRLHTDKVIAKMDIEQVREYCLSLLGVTEDSPYGPDMIVFRIEGKIFLHLPLEYAEPRISIKLPPEKGQSLRDSYETIRAGYHLNKIHWNDILIENTFASDQIKDWILESYNLVLNSLPKRLKAKYQ
nr:MmcQ/YjbR family DNA-binding protein [Xylanibacter oryzae]